jgi:hypothetical protein
LSDRSSLVDAAAGFSPRSTIVVPEVTHLAPSVDLTRRPSSGEVGKLVEDSQITLANYRPKKIRNKESCATTSAQLAEEIVRAYYLI